MTAPSESTAARAKRLLAEERTGVGWTVPRPSFGTDWPRVATRSITLAALTLLAVGIPALTIDYVRHHGSNYTSLIGVAIGCALFVAVMTPLNTYFLCPRLRLTLISDGIIQRYGSLKTLTTYKSLQAVRILRTPKHPSGIRLLILVDEKRGIRWHRFDFGDEVLAAEIAEAFQSHGLLVDVTDNAEM